MMTETDKKESFNKAVDNHEKWSNRSDFENSQINVDFLSEWVVPADQISLHQQWIFSHTPKTAGTSFDRFLAQYFQLKDTLHVNAPDLNRLPQVVHLKNDFPQLISGHHPIHALLYQLLPAKDLVHLGMMRNPLNRVVSYYNYLSTRDYHALNKRVREMHFDDFINLQDLPELHNGQSKRLAGVLHSNENIRDNELYHRAKHCIDNCFSLVGVTEKLTDFCQYLNRQVKIPGLEIPRINSSKIKIQLKDLTVEQRIKVEVNNMVDIQLYEYVLSKFNKIVKN